MQIENCPEQVFVALAVNAIGAVKVPVNISLSARELGFVLEQSQSQYLITGCHIDLEKNETALKLVVTLPQADCHMTVSYTHLFPFHSSPLNAVIWFSEIGWFSKGQSYSFE